MIKIQNQNKEDLKFLSLAINLARKNITLTSPNPSVGAVIVKDGVILATGITAKGGRPHAEELAISKISAKNLKDATIYISLEPCCHNGRSKLSCTDLIIKSLIKRVVFAIKDPDPRTCGKSISKLQEAGIKVDCNLMEKEARQVNRGFFSSKLKNRPFITAKIAISIDGKIATKSFDSKWISNISSRKYTNYLRSKNDAILIGANSFKKDSPTLNCRINGLENKSPKRIILNKNFNLNLSNEFLDSCQNIATFFVVREDLQIISEYKNINFIKLPLNNQNQLDLNYLMIKLNNIGINNLLIEGGSKIFASFLKENLIDELIIVKGDFILGSDAISSIDNLKINLISDIENKFLIDKVIKIQENLVVKYCIATSSKTK